MWTTTATDLKAGVETSQLKVTSALEMNTMTEQTWVMTKTLWHKAVNKSSRTRSKIQDRTIIIHATRSSEHESNLSFQVSIRRVYENAHRVSEDVTLQYGKLKSMNKDMENHPYLNDSKQKTEIIKAHVLHPESSFLHMTRERKMSRSWIPKG
jgi:NAD-specific glutamate dehydrogenase